MSPKTATAPAKAAPKTTKLVPRLLSKAVAAALMFVSRDQTRPVLRSVLVTPTQVFATDSYRAVCITSGEEGLTSLDFPNSERRELGIPEEGVMIDGQALKLALKRLPSRAMLPILNRIAIAIDGANVQLITDDLDVQITTTARRCEGLFPDFEKIMTHEEGAEIHGIAVNPHFLKQVAEAAIKFGCGNSPIGIEFTDRMKPIHFYAKNDNQDKFHAIVMPVRPGEGWK